MSHRPVRNRGEQLFGTVKLENRNYVAKELVPIVGRNKRRIQALCEELEIGQLFDPLKIGDPVRVLSRRDVEKILKWFDANGRKHWEAPWTENHKKPSKRSKKQAV